MENQSIPELELKILQSLWSLERGGSVQEIVDTWKDSPVPGYTTVLKKLQIMENKNLVRHEKEGRAYRYIPLVSKEEVSKRKIQNLLSRVFLGNKLDMVGAFFADAKLTENEISEIKGMIENWENKHD